MSDNPMGPTVDDGSTDVAAVVENMQRSKAAAVTGIATVDEDAPPPPEAPEPPSLQDLGLMGIVTDSSAWIRAQPAVTVDQVSTEPGTTQRGWSPEVTARHPKLVAATMAELAGGGGEASDEPVPSDAFLHKAWLRNAAIRLNYQRLTQGLDFAFGSSPAVQAAFAQAVAEAQAQAGEGDGAPAPTPNPTPTPTPTPTPEPTPEPTP